MSKYDYSHVFPVASNSSADYTNFSLSVRVGNLIRFKSQYQGDIDTGMYMILCVRHEQTYTALSLWDLTKNIVVRRGPSKEWLYSNMIVVSMIPQDSTMDFPA